MGKNRSFFIIVIVFAVLLIGAYVVYNMTGNMVGEGVSTLGKTQAADFTVYDSNKNEVRLSDFDGEPVVLNFWASWCGPCMSEMPEFEKAFKQYGKDVNFMMVNMTDGSRETIETATGYIKSEGYTMPVYFDTQLSAASAYDVMSIPATYFIDSDGNIVNYTMGAIDGNKLLQGIEAILE